MVPDVARPPVHPGTLEAFCAQLRAAGWSHVRTMAGLVPLDEWAPYGTRRQDPPSVLGLRVDGGRVLEEPTVAHASKRDWEGFFFGVWELVKPEGQEGGTRT